MPSLLMPKATAVWLIDNTTLTFEQISEFCDLHILEVQAIADGDVGQGILGFDPILNGLEASIEMVYWSVSSTRDPSTYNLKKPLEYVSDKLVQILSDILYVVAQSFPSNGIMILFCRLMKTDSLLLFMVPSPKETRFTPSKD